MKVKCVMCDRIDEINDDSFEAKRLRNRRVSLYLCKNCHDRIGENTKKRIETGKFKFYRERNQNNNDLV